MRFIDRLRSRTTACGMVFLLPLMPLLASCGGGGALLVEDDDPPSAPVRFEASFDRDPLAVSLVQGQDTEITLYAYLSYNGSQTLTIALEEGRDLVVDGAFDISDTGTLKARLVLDPARPPGVYTSEILLRGCLDAACTREAAGSPVRLPLRYEVLAQIAIEAPQPFRRRGAAPAPAQRLAVTATPQAGTLELLPSGEHTAFELSFADGTLQVRPRQVRAGHYQARVELRSRSDGRFAQAVDLDYVVEAPEAGEYPLRATPNFIDLTLDQGQVTTRRIRISPPTWTDAPLEVSLLASDVVRVMQPVGPDEWELTVDTRGVSRTPPFGGPHVARVVATVRSEGETYEILPQVSVNIEPPLRVSETPVDWLIERSSTPVDLTRTLSVTSPDGEPWVWTARTDSPWLRLSSSQGVAGRDPLVLTLDPSVLDLPSMQPQAVVELSSGRPGTLPMPVEVLVRNQVPRLDAASPGVLAGSTAQVYLVGNLGFYAGGLDPGTITVDGATVRERQLVFDRRFLHEVLMLRLDLDGIEPGRDVTISAVAPLRNQPLRLPAARRDALPAGHAVLPAGRYRPPVYLPGARSLVFAGDGQVWRWPLAGGVWAAPQSRAVEGLIDIDPAPDESVLRGLAAPAQTLALDPLTLDTLRTGTLATTGWNASPALPDAEAHLRLSALRHAADGRAFASLRATDPVQSMRRGVGWLSGCLGDRVLTLDVTQLPCFADPGAETLRDPAPATVGAGIARSPGRTMLVVSYPNGSTLRYRDLGTQREQTDAVPAGRVVVALDDAAAWMVQDDGRLRRAGSPEDELSLASLVDPALTAGGYAISGAGDFAVVYAWRQAEEAGVPRARDPVLLLWDLRGGLAGLRATPTPVASVALPDAVGCLGAPASCTHQAHVLVTPGDQGAFVLGPQGVAAVPLPALPPRLAAAAGPRKAMRGVLLPAGSGRGP